MGFEIEHKDDGEQKNNHKDSEEYFFGEGKPV